MTFRPLLPALAPALKPDEMLFHLVSDQRQMQKSRWNVPVSPEYVQRADSLVQVEPSGQ
jgi:hypothetical protein